MKSRFLEAVKSSSLYHLLYTVILTYVIYNFFLLSRGEQANSLFSHYLESASAVFLCVSSLFLILIFLSLSFKKEGRTSLIYSGIVLFPIALLSFFRPLKPQDFPLFMPLALVVATQVFFFLILSKDESVFRTGERKEKLIILLFIALYFIFFGFIGVRKLDTFSFFNANDFAIYNQTFWNTIHGRFFQNSSYGSNFSCHNTLFFWALAPFYYLRPVPLTLLFLKNLLLALSAIPFYLIAKSTSRDIPLAPAVLAFMLFPYLISQNLIPPHEITYAPFFLLFTYYFFKTNRLFPFLIFLAASLSIKESLSFVAVMFGALALFSKKNSRWIFAPLLLGTAWAFISLLIICHFQKIYASHPDAAWFIVYLKKNSLAYFVSRSNASHWHTLKLLFPLFSSLGIILPLLSPAIILSLPELFINLLSDRPALFSPAWYYNVTASCFLLIASIEGIKKISESKWIVCLKINNRRAVALLSTLMLSCVLMHSYLWLGLLKYPRDYAYAKAVREAIRILPENAFVSAPRNIAIRVSARERYSLPGEGRLGDYILTDRKYESLLSAETLKDYSCLFNKGGIKVFKKIR